MGNVNQQNKIRVMHLVTGWLDKIYGGEAAALALVRKADKDKFYCVVVSFKDPRADAPPPLINEAKKSGIATEVIYLKWRFGICAVFRLKKLLRKYNIDILHCHGYKADTIGFLTSRLTKVRLVSTCHGWWPNTPKLKFYDFIDTTVLKFFDSVVAVSPQIYDNLVKRKVNPSKLKVIQNGIDVSQFDMKAGRERMRKELGIKEEDFVVGSIGRLSSEKGITYLLEAAYKIKAKKRNISFVIVGEGDMKSSLIDYAKELGISDKVIFTGYREDIDKIFPVLDVFVMPSLTEGLPLALLEAMAAGKPVVASNVGGIPTVIEHGKTGILVKSRNAAEIESAILDLINDKHYSDILADNGKKFVENKFSLTATIKKYEELYIKLLKDSQRNILIISLQGLGDLLLATPLLANLKANFKDSKVTILTFKANTAILSGNPHVDAVISVEPRKMIDILLMLFRLRREHFDLSICIYPSGLRSAFIGYLSGAKERLGQELSLFKGYRWLFTRQTPIKEVKHAVLMNLDFLELLNLDPREANMGLILNLTEEDLRFSSDFLKDNKIEKKERIVAIHAGGGRFTAAYRNWPLERFAKVADSLIERFNAKVILIGGSGDKASEEAMLHMMEHKPITAVGKASLKQTAALVQKADLLICNNSGPMHIAAALKTPTISIFGSADPRIHRPWGEGHIVLQKPLECSPCYYPFFGDTLEETKLRNSWAGKRFRCKTGDYRCLSSVAVEDVLNATEAILKERVDK